MPRPIVLSPIAIVEALAANVGSIHKAAASLDISPATLRRWIQNDVTVGALLAELDAPGSHAAEQLERRLESSSFTHHEKVIESRTAIYRINKLEPISTTEAETFLARVRSPIKVS